MINNLPFNLKSSLFAQSIRLSLRIFRVLSGKYFFASRRESDRKLHFLGFFVLAIFG